VYINHSPDDDAETSSNSVTGAVLMVSMQPAAGAKPMGPKRNPRNEGLDSERKPTMKDSRWQAAKETKKS